MLVRPRLSFDPSCNPLVAPVGESEGALFDKKFVR